jgi:Short C-terminal domain
MPGLIRGVARTAVVAGTATAVSNRVSRRQANRWASQSADAQNDYYAQPPQAPASSGNEDRLAQLKELGELRASGVLTEAEFQQQKASILAG